MLFPGQSPKRSLQKSLRLPRASASVAHWLFDQPHLSFHTNAPLLSALAFSGSMAVHVRDFWTKFGRDFDPFSFCQLHINEGSPSTTHGSFESNSSTENLTDTEPLENTTMDIDLVLTPVLRATQDVIAGYALCTGPSFDPESKKSQAAFLRGRSNIIGRFAFDMDNDHIILVFHAITPQISGIVDVTTNGLSRNRFLYAIPNAEYGPDDLPTQALSLMVSSELRSPIDKLCSRPLSLNSAPNHQLVSHVLKLDGRKEEASTTDSSNTSNCRNNLNVVISREKVNVSRTYLKDIESLVSDLDLMTPAWDGAFSGQNVVRSTDDLPQFNVQPTQYEGNVLSQYFIPNFESRREMIADAWRLYSQSTFCLRSQPQEVRLIADDDDHSFRSGNKPVKSICSSRKHSHPSSSSSSLISYGRITKVRRISDDCASVTSGKSYQEQSSYQQTSSIENNSTEYY